MLLKSKFVQTNRWNLQLTMISSHLQTIPSNNSSAIYAFLPQAAINLRKYLTVVKRY